jgi:Zn-dependent peptidase ImmA (M78 family)
MTLATLSRVSKLTMHSITHFENRRKVPSPKSLERLVAALDVTPEYLSAPPPIEIPPETMSLRSPTRLSARKKYSAVAVAALTATLNAWMETHLRLPDPNVPAWPQLDPEDAAEALRAHWHLGDAPVGVLIPLLEAKGVRVFALPPDCADVGPFSTAHPAPLVFLPPNLTGEQARHLLAHELGQLVLRHSRPGSREAHFEAGKFAAAFLMPRTAVIAAMLGSAEPHRLASAASTWGVTTRAIIRRLRDLELLHEWSFRHTLSTLGSEGDAPAPANTDISEASHLLPKAVSCLQAHGLPLHLAAELTALDIDHPPRWPAQPPYSLSADNEERDAHPATPASDNKAWDQCCQRRSP